VKIIRDDGSEVALHPGDWFMVGAGGPIRRVLAVPYGAFLTDGGDGCLVTDFQDPGSWQGVYVEGDWVDGPNQ
jgi:hypothetical protein